MKIRMLCLMAVLFTAACAVKMPQITTYSFVVPTPPVNTALPQTHAVLLVSLMTADPAYKTANMIYVKNPGDLQYYSVNAWVAPPAQMLTPLIEQKLEAKRYFRAIVTPPFVGLSNYRLDTRLVMLQQEFYGPESQVRCVVEALLTRGEEGKVVASRRFQAVIAAPGNNPQSGAAAANRAALQISDEIADFVIEHVSHP
jgi:cholesterol transport system auxiliary component